MWEKKKVSDGNSGNFQECTFCERPKCTVLCFNCGHTINNTRVRTVCSGHPKALFLMDINACPNCKTSGQLKECLPGEFQKQIVTMTPTPPRPIKPDAASPASPFNFSLDAPTFVQNVDTSPGTAPVGFQGSFENSGIDLCQPICFNSGAQRKGRGRGIPSVELDLKPAQKAASTLFGSAAENSVAKALIIPAPADSNATSIEACSVCSRKVDVFCLNCGFVSQPGCRKYKFCGLHPDNTSGLRECPDCKLGLDTLEEQ